MLTARRAWAVYAAGLFAYMVAVMQRSTVGVAGVVATERFHSDAAALSALAVLQLVVYAAMQIPVGMLIDRVGPRNLVITGTALMLAGQVVVAFSPTLTMAVAGRILVGAGDAMTFTTVLRLTASWFPGDRVPVLSQWVGTTGQLGQVASAVPFAFFLHTTGWTRAFLGAAACSFLALLLLIFVVRNHPRGMTGAIERPASIRESLHLLRGALARPGTRLGFWAHFTTQSSGTIFGLMWGYPFMVYALGYPPTLAADLLVVLVAAGLVTGPILGVFSARYPFRRSNLVLGVIVLMAVLWTVLLTWPGTPPLWLVVVLLVAIGVGGPGSIIGFDYARMFNPAGSLGSANGIVNTGGFIASVVMIFSVGLVLDLVAPAGAAPTRLYSLDAFRLAFCVQYVVVGTGVVFFLRARRRTRSRMAEEEGIAVGPLWRAAVRRWRMR